MGKNDGGPAFPSHQISVASGGSLTLSGDYQESGGMSLRDYFAAKAMHAELNTSGWHAGSAAALASAAEDAGRSVEQQIAFNAYLIADAMLAERAK